MMCYTKESKKCCPRTGRVGQVQLLLTRFVGEKIGLPRGRGGRGVWGEFRRARAFRRSEAEAVNSSQRNFAQSLEYPTNRNFRRFGKGLPRGFAARHSGFAQGAKP